MTHLDDPYRLPRTVLPRRYELHLEPDLERARFTGSVTITADVTATSTAVVMNAKDLEIHSVSVNDTAMPWSLDAATERLIISTTTALQPGSARIDVAFTGILNDKLRGFYRSTYRDDDGTEHVIATTQMQSTDCRGAFPCFDEPDMKAVFAISMDVDPRFLAVSNASEKSRIALDNGKERVTFHDTIPMSTYLVAFVVGPLEATQVLMAGNVALRVIHVPGKGHLADYGLKAAKFSLQWYEKYYGIPYPGDKIDLLALPDFAAGAMENFGCITFREVLLLIDPATATKAEKQVLVDVVSHELSHMWFGDMVTMRWWNGIWLNEAFATFMEVAATAAFEPGWNRWTAFATERTAAFDVDSLHSTRPVEFAVESPDDSEGMFDVLTYEKGGSLLRMLEQYVGEERFRLGVGHYLSRHMYGNTETNDLWDAIEAKVNELSDVHFPVRSMMDSWIWQAGYPLVTATVSGTTLSLSQQRFSFDDSPDGSKWYIPVILSVDGELRTVVLDDFSTTVELPREDAVVVVNATGWGFYRVAYQPELLARLSGTELRRLTELERYTLVDDSWNAVVAGAMTPSTFMNLLRSYADEDSPSVWQAIAMSVRGLWRITDDAHLESFGDFVRSITSNIFDRLGWQPADGESELQSQLRGIVIALRGVQGLDPDVISRSRSIVSDNDTTSVHPEVMAAATTVVASHGTADDYRTFLGRFREPSTPQERLRMLYALADFPDAESMRRTVEAAFTDDIKTQDAPLLLMRCILNRSQGGQAWTMVRQRWQEATARFPVNTIIRLAQPTRELSRPEHVADVQAFFAEHPIPQAAKMLEQALERQRVNATMRQRIADELSTVLGDR